MPKTFVRRWNAEAGRGSGVIIKKLPHDTKFKW
jgi:hypothetical protein